MCCVVLFPLEAEFTGREKSQGVERWKIQFLSVSGLCDKKSVSSLYTSVKTLKQVLLIALASLLGEYKNKVKRDD